MLTPSLAGAFALGLICLTAAHGQARIDDCEKIQAADAYNQCLAKFGPESKVKSVEPERPGDVKSSSAEAAATAGPPKGQRHAGIRRRGRAAHGGGRMHMSFSVKRRHK
jgi:hypothetical protein